MKHIKQFEGYFGKDINVGDYVIMKDSKDSHVLYNEFISTHIGIIKEIYPWNNFITVKYYNVPENIKPFFKSSNNYYQNSYFPNDIIEYSSDRKKLKLMMDAKKYNL